MSILLWKGKSIKNLSFGSTNISGRNNSGKITSYHRGGGCKKLIRVIDFNRYVWNIYGFVHRLEYDPKRNSLIALVVYSNGIMSYIIAPENVNVGDCVLAKEDIVFKPGNSTYLYNVPIGLKVNSIELVPNAGAQLIRAAGSYATVISRFESTVIVKLKSGELRKISSNCLATIGSVSNFQYIYRNFKKAGFYRLKGWRPVVRGVAMNPVDHPHGGGQGKTSGGRPSVTPYGFITKGKPTKKKKSSAIIKSRREVKRK
jgi:large subunit ribosomal protein L2